MQTQVLSAPSPTDVIKTPKQKLWLDNFAGQWLELRPAWNRSPPIREKFPMFDEYLKMSMRRETEMFFENMIPE